jgi:hypothetical protein
LTFFDLAIMSKRDPRCVFVSPSASEADIVVTMLGHAGIPARVMDRTTLGGFVGLTVWSSNGISSRGLEVWVMDEKDLSHARTILGEFEAQKRIAAEEKRALGPIDALCEECGRTTTFPAEARGTVQDCRHCSAYLDVPGGDESDWHMEGDGA